jgi:NADH-quinone oxidoreductase subunit N
MRDRDCGSASIHVLMLFALLGIMIMISANGFLTMYLGLELLALCLYALVAFDRDSKMGAEAAMKYFVLGALGSGMLLYGISMLYGATGSWTSRPCRRGGQHRGHGEQDPGLRAGVRHHRHRVQVRRRAVPHVDAGCLSGAPTPVVLFLSSAPKIAAFAMAARILVEASGGLQGTGARS